MALIPHLGQRTPGHYVALEAAQHVGRTLRDGVVAAAVLAKHPPLRQRQHAPHACVGVAAKVHVAVLQRAQPLAQARQPKRVVQEADGAGAGVLAHQVHVLQCGGERVWTGEGE
eukprot:365143-Chlamydomonas_euryale.AAC.2